MATACTRPARLSSLPPDYGYERKRPMTDPLPEYHFLLRCLGPVDDPATLSGLRAKLDAGAIDWSVVIRIADREMLSPALHPALSAKGLLDAVPAAVADGLRRRFVGNSARNAKIRKEALGVIANLNDIGIEPALLKGGLHLFEAPPGEVGGRMMHDLDFMVPEADIERAIESLRGMGYEPDQQSVRWTHAYFPLVHPTAMVAIDLHRYVGGQRVILPAAEAWREAVAVPADGMRLRALHPTHQVLHNIFHSQIQDRGHEFAIVYPRQLLALAGICRRHEAAIDWQALGRLMETHNLGRQLRARLYQAEQLLGLPRPAGISPTAGDRFHHWRCLLQIRHDWLMRLMSCWSGATSPFMRHHLEMIYGNGSNPVRINAHRLRHAWFLLRKYAGHTGLARQKMTYMRIKH